jgi:hypothetical protein
VPLRAPLTFRPLKPPAQLPVASLCLLLCIIIIIIINNHNNNNNNKALQLLNHLSPVAVHSLLYSRVPVTRFHSRFRLTISRALCRGQTRPTSIPLLFSGIHPPTCQCRNIHLGVILPWTALSKKPSGHLFHGLQRCLTYGTEWSKALTLHYTARLIIEAPRRDKPTHILQSWMNCIRVAPKLDIDLIPTICRSIDQGRTP